MCIHRVHMYIPISYHIISYHSHQVGFPFFFFFSRFRCTYIGRWVTVSYLTVYTVRVLHIYLYTYIFLHTHLEQNLFVSIYRIPLHILYLQSLYIPVPIYVLLIYVSYLYRVQCSTLHTGGICKYGILLFCGALKPMFMYVVCVCVYKLSIMFALCGVAGWGICVKQVPRYPEPPPTPITIQPCQSTNI